MFNIKDAHKLMDELYRPTVSSKDSTLLTEQVREEMISKGLDPINIDDIQEFWKSKGIDGKLYI
jgi:hypothetical protein